MEDDTVRNTLIRAGVLLKDIEKGGLYQVGTPREETALRLDRAIYEIENLLQGCGIKKRYWVEVRGFWCRMPAFAYKHLGKHTRCTATWVVHEDVPAAADIWGVTHGWRRLGVTHLMQRRRRGGGT